MRHPHDPVLQRLQVVGPFDPGQDLRRGLSQPPAKVLKRVSIFEGSQRMSIFVRMA